ncbi:MAG: trypsin-like peptidase domain-containing protein [Planctomycetaceae bacterium]|nr:trypsin-like peptidase domain-containing protein [Planctomycetaceae bacterium]
MSNFQHDPDSIHSLPEAPRELVYEYLGASEPMTNTAAKPANAPSAEQPAQLGPVVIRTRPLSILLFVLCFLLALYLIPNIAANISYSLTRGSERAKAEVAAEFLEAIPDHKQLIPWVVKKAAPSVVSIQVIGNVQRDENMIRNVPIGQGSGVIVDKDGYIVTNHHVIRNSRNYRVFLSDGRQTDNVRLVGFDPATDLAVLKINLPELMPITWGDSSSLEVGESVLAIGSPYSFANTVTCGIISAKERYAQEFETPVRLQPQEYLQTDAAVNPGNSGGPLIDMQGEVIGINTMILGETYRGICFAIPSTLARRVYEEIREKGRVTYGWIGINMSDRRETKPGDEGNRSIGVRILSVVPDLPAEKAGMLAGDIITNWNGIDIRDYVQLNHAILFTPPGTTVKVACLRDNKPIEFDVTVDQRPVRRFR